MENQTLKVLLITGTLAEDTVKRYAKESSIETETLALKMSVAALLTPQAIADALKTKKLAGFNMLLSSRLTPWRHHNNFKSNWYSSV